MQHNRLTRLFPTIIGIIFMISLAGCSSGGTQVPIPTAQASPTSIPPTQDTGGLTADEFSTLSSLQKLDDYPFYVMHYSGDYQPTWTNTSLQAISDISCSLFASMPTSGDMYYGRNFDWDFSPSLLLFTDPPDGYASVSMVALSFFGISPEAARALADIPVAERTVLLSTPMLPFDGMNEYGLAVGMAAVPDEYADDASHDPALPTISSIGIIRMALDHAKNVDEAIQLFKQYNIDFTGGPPIHYLLADKSGKAVLVEYYQGKMVLLPNEADYHLATNHLRCNAEGDGGCWRYHILYARLNETGARLDQASAMHLLSDVRQEYTQWSSVYDMTTGGISISIGRNYSTSYSFHLELLHP